MLRSEFALHAQRSTHYAQRSTPRALLLSQPPRHLLENTPLLARQALEPLGGDLVEYAVNVFGFQVARGNLSTRRNCRRPLRGDRLTLRHDLVYFLNPLARTRQRSGDRARWILGVGHLRDSLSQLLDAHTWRCSHVQPRHDEPAEVSKVRDVGSASGGETEQSHRQVESDEEEHEREHAHRQYPHQEHLLLRPLQRVGAHDAENRPGCAEEHRPAVTEEQRVADQSTEPAQQIEEHELLRAPEMLEPRTEDE